MVESILDQTFTKNIKQYIVFLALFFLYSEAFAYRLKDEDVIVVGGIITSCIYDISTKGNVIEIPDILDGQTITGIGDYAFTIAGKIAILTLPTTLKTIGKGVFEGHALTSLVIPSGVTFIGDRAFYGNALSALILPPGLKTIGFQTFTNNQLSDIIIPNGVEIIRGWAFENNKITSLDIPNSLKVIERGAFKNNKISVLSFQTGCQLKEISDSCFTNNDLKNLELPNSLFLIGNWAFCDNVNLTKVDFSQNLLRIKYEAFARCNISSLNLPNNLVFIGKSAFIDNKNLKNFQLPTSTNNYKWNDSNGDKFNGGDLVTNMWYSYVAIIPYVIKDEDVDVDNGIITRCSYFEDVANLGSVITIPDILDGQQIIGINYGFQDKGISEINLPSGLKNIGHWVFNKNEIINLSLPNSLIEIGDGAFDWNCINTLSFQSTSSLKKIGVLAFSGNRLITVEFPQSVMVIEKSSFRYNLLQNVKFEDKSQLISIGSSAFWGNGQLNNFSLPDPKVNSYDYWIDWNSTQYSTNLVVTNFNSFYKIPIPYTLKDNDVTVENGVIVSTSFSNSLGNIIVIPEILDNQKIIGIGNNVFQAKGLIGVNLPPSLENIGPWAFWENDILKITIPENVKKIQFAAFGANNISELIFDKNSRLNTIEAWAFRINRITSVSFPDSLSSIGGYAFNGNQISKEVYIPEKTRFIEEYAFSWNRIPQVYFVENGLLTRIGKYAFIGNQISNEIIIPKNLTEISEFAFSDNKISKIITHERFVDYGTGAFLNNNSLLNIVLHTPPTIPKVTHFFGWKDNNGVYHYQGESITDFGNRYKAVIDQFFVVKFIVKDDNKDPIENASIQFYGSTLTTDVNGIDSIGPVMRGLQNYKVSAPGCIDFAGSVDVQDNMIVPVSLVRYYNVNITVIDASNNPISGVDVLINGATLTSGADGKANIKLIDGNYPFVIHSPGYQESASSVTVFNADNSIVVKLYRVLVNYLPNGGTGASFTETTVGTKYFTISNPFVRSAYAFSYWNTKPDNSGITYAEKASVSLGFSDIDLYAIWTPVDYNIVYHLNGGMNAPANPAKYNIESDINFQPASKPSLYFATWLDADSNRVNKIEKGSIGDIELWAVFTAEPTYFIDYHNLQNASHNNQPIYTKFDLPLLFTEAKKIGYEFTGWYEDPSFTKQITTIPVGSTKNYDVYAKWGGAIEFAINYSLAGGTNNPANPAKYTIESNKITFEPPAKTGAKFVAWYSDNALTKKIIDIPAGSIGDTTVYAKWELDTFDIQYVLNGGINNPANPAKFTIESNMIILQKPDRAGFIFDGWFTSSNYAARINSVPKGSVGDITIYAKWIELFDVNFIITTDGKNPARDIDIVINNTQRQRSDIEGLADTIMPDGSSLKYSIEINGIVIDYGSVTISGSDVTVKVEIVDCYIRWYDVLFCDNGKGLWTDFVWSKDNIRISEEQFFHNPGGIKGGKYTLVVTSVNGIEYIWVKEYNSFDAREVGNEAGISEMTLFPNPLTRGKSLFLVLSDDNNLQTFRILIYYSTGDLIKIINNPLYMNEINIDSKFSSGVYHVILSDEKNKIQTVKNFIVY